MAANNQLYAPVLDWRFGPATYSLSPRLSLRQSNISDLGKKNIEFVARDLGAKVKVGYIVGYGYYQSFIAWYKSELRLGANWFYIYLPSPAGYQWVLARFLSPYAGTPLGGRAWSVTFELELRERPLLDSSCTVENFRDGLAAFKQVGGTNDLAMYYPTPDDLVGKALVALAIDASYNGTAIERKIPPRVLKSVRLKVNMLEMGAGAATRFAIQIGATTVLAFTVATDPVTDSLRRATLVLDGIPKVIGTAPIPSGDWYQIAVDLDEGAGNSRVVITKVTSGSVLYDEALTNDYTFKLVDSFSFISSQAADVGTLEFADIHICS